MFRHDPIASSLSTAAFSKREAIPDDKEQGMGDSGGSACLSTGF